MTKLFFFFFKKAITGRYCYLRREGKYLPSARVQHPAESECPADGGVAAQAPPAQHQVRGEGLAGREDGKEDENRGDEVVEGLEGEDLGEDAEGGEVLEGAGAGRTAVA